MNPFGDLIPTKNSQSPAVASSAPTPFDDLIPGRQPVASSRPTEEPKKEGTAAGRLAKSLFTAPATIVARPLQLAAELVMPGDNSEAIDKFSREKLGGVVAPLPKSGKDVVKDVGRGIQTVALGTAAPIAGGAAFGLGSSLEQGEDLFSAETAINTVLGGAGGKVLEWVGKPLLNGAGKVIGTITPQTVKDLAGKGAGYIKKFAETHQLLGGAAAPISEKIASGFQKVDEKAGSLFKGTGTKFKDAISSQYPGLSKESLTKRYTNVEAKNFAKPSETPSASYRKATEIFKNAQGQGTDLADVAVKNGVRHDSLIEGGKYNTVDTADALRADAMKTSRDLIRPALAAAEPGVPKVPISQLRDKLISRVDNIPSTQITDAERELMKRRITTEYGDISAAARAHPEGFSLTDLHDNSIAMNLKGKYKFNGTSSDEFKARTAREAGAVFRELLESNAPEDLAVGKFKAELQKKFQLADYLEALNNKKVPMGLVQKAVDLFGKVAGATAGAKLGGGLGGVAGYHLGGVLFDAFENLPNPVKAKYLNSIARETPEVFKAFQDYLGKKEVEKLMQLKLPGAGQSSYKEPGQRFFTSPGGKTGTNMQEVADIAATEGKNVKVPKGGKKGVDARRKLREMLDSNIPITPDSDLPVIKIPKRTQKLKDLYSSLPGIEF